MGLVDLFGNAYIPKKARKHSRTVAPKKTRSHSRIVAPPIVEAPVEQPVRPRIRVAPHLAEQINQLRSLTKCRFWQSPEKEVEEIHQVIQRFKNWEKLFPKVKRQLTKVSNMTVIQAIRFVNGDKNFITHHFKEER